MLAAVTASFITAGEHGWLAPLPGALLVAALVTGWLFVRAERRHPHPLLPLTLFRSRELSGATGVGLLFNLVLYGTLLCLSLYLQQARHESVLATGLLLLPSSVITGAGSLASGGLTARLGPRPPMIAGLALAAAGTALLATAGTGTPLALIVAGSLLIGLISLAMPAMVAAVVGAAGAGARGRGQRHPERRPAVRRRARRGRARFPAGRARPACASRSWRPRPATWSPSSWPGSPSGAAGTQAA